MGPPTIEVWSLTWETERGDCDYFELWILGRLRDRKVIERRYLGKAYLEISSVMPVKYHFVTKIINLIAADWYCFRGDELSLFN